MEDGEVWDSLYLQLRALCGKELVVIGEGKMGWRF